MFRSHCGSRAISVQVNIVAVSDHAFHSSLFGFLSLVSTLFFGLMSQPRVVDASGTAVTSSPMQLSSSNFGSLHGSVSDLGGTPEVPRMRTMPFFQNLYISKHRSRKFLISRLGGVTYHENTWERIYHIGCTFNLHSIINSGLILGGQILSNRQTAFSLLVDPMDKEHKDLDTIVLNAPRPAQHMHKAWKKHQQQCGSRGVFVQVNVVSVSDYAFHKFPFDLLIQVSATQLSQFLCISFVMMATDRVKDAMHTSLPGSPPLSSNVGSPPWSWS